MKRLFFRVFDVANGLDTRRHFFLDVASEEYADERVASPAVRVSYTFNNGVEIDAFVQMFSPTLLPGLNTPYNLVTSGFSWDNEIELDRSPEHAELRHARYLAGYGQPHRAGDGREPP